MGQLPLSPGRLTEYAVSQTKDENWPGKYEIPFIKV